MSNESFSLNPSLDATRLAERYRIDRRIDIPDFLRPGQAEVLRDHLLARPDWVMVMNAGDRVYELPRSKMQELSEEQRRQLDASVIGAARNGFQYRFDSIRAPDGGGTDTLLDRFVSFMSSPGTLGFLATVTGHPDLHLADGQATSYRAGDFLTEHDDDVAGKNRRAAYVFGITSAWSSDWGGLLMFPNEDGRTVQAFPPGMNRLRLFSVPARHSVSYVAAFADQSRLSVTGWLRARHSSE